MIWLKIIFFRIKILSDFTTHNQNSKKVKLEILILTIKTSRILET
jgi:hypothetical protein